MNDGLISCFFRVDKVVAVGVSNKLFFIDFRTKKIINGNNFQVNGSYVLCMQSYNKVKVDKTLEKVLLV